MGSGGMLAGSHEPELRGIMPLAEADAEWGRDASPSTDLLARRGGGYAGECSSTRQSEHSGVPLVGAHTGWGGGGHRLARRESQAGAEGVTGCRMRQGYFFRYFGKSKLITIFVFD